MLSVNGTTGVNAVQDTVVSQVQNLPFRGRTDYERTPEYDTYESGKKHTGLKALLCTGGLAAIGLGVASYFLGKKALPENSEFGKIMKKGWQIVKHSVKKAFHKPDEKAVERLNKEFNNKIQKADSKEALEKLSKGINKYGSEETKKAYADAMKKLEEAANNAGNAAAGAA